MDGDWCPDPTCIVDNILFEFVRSSWKTLANTAKKCWKIFQTKKRELHSFIHLVKWSDGNSVRSMVTREKETEIDIWWGVWEKVEKSKKEIVFVFVALVFFSLLHSSLLVFSHRRTAILIFNLIGKLSVKGVLKSLIFNTVERNGEIETKKIVKTSRPTKSRVHFSKCTVVVACLQIKVIYTKYSKHWPYTVAHTIDCVCRKS